MRAGFVTTSDEMRRDLLGSEAKLEHADKLHVQQQGCALSPVSMQACRQVNFAESCRSPAQRTLSRSCCGPRNKAGGLHSGHLMLGPVQSR